MKFALFVFVFWSTCSFVPHADGCPLTNRCANKYVWPESEIGTVNTSYPCVQRRCGGTYSTGGQWEPVVITCATDYVSCAISELEDLLTAAVNNTKVSVCKIHLFAYTLWS